MAGLEERETLALHNPSRTSYTAMSLNEKVEPDEDSLMRERYSPAFLECDNH